MMASTNRAPLVRLTRASKSWFAGDQRIQILQRIEVNVFMGASLAIMGPSGAGKSTLLHILGLLTPIDAGTLEFAGQRIDNSTNCWKSTLRSQIGLIFQDAKLIPELTVMGNVCVPLVHRGFWPASQKKLALEALSRVGLADRIDHKPNQLSGGELMRAAIARAIVQRPRGRIEVAGGFIG